MVEWVVPGIQFQASRISPKNRFFSSYFDIVNDFHFPMFRQHLWYLGKKFEIP